MKDQMHSISNAVIYTERSGKEPAYILQDTNRQQVSDMLKVCRQQKQTVTELIIQNKGGENDEEV